MPSLPATAKAPSSTPAASGGAPSTAGTPVANGLAGPTASTPSDFVAAFSALFDTQAPVTSPAGWAMAPTLPPTPGTTPGTPAGTTPGATPAPGSTPGTGILPSLPIAAAELVDPPTGKPVEPAHMDGEGAVEAVETAATDLIALVGALLESMPSKNAATAGAPTGKPKTAAADKSATDTKDAAPGLPFVAAVIHILKALPPEETMPSDPIPLDRGAAPLAVVVQPPTTTTDDATAATTPDANATPTLATTETRSTSTTADARPTATVHTPVGHPKWATAVGAEVRLLIDRGLHGATLRLSPEDLGPLQVRIEIGDDGAQVWFGAAHPDTRAALADALPRLREMFSAAGLQLADAGVHRDAPRNPSSNPVPTAPVGGSSSAGADDGEVAAVTLRALGLVDEYA